MEKTFKPIFKTKKKYQFFNYVSGLKNWFIQNVSNTDIAICL